jgi:hypothetical protein
MLNVVAMDGMGEMDGMDSPFSREKEEKSTRV